MEINLLLSYSLIHKKSIHALFGVKSLTSCKKIVLGAENVKYQKGFVDRKRKIKWMIDIKNLMIGGFDYVKNYGLRFFISNDIWNIKNKFNQQYSVVQNEQQFCTETTKSSRDRHKQ